MYNMNAFIHHMPFNTIYYQSSFRKNPFLLISYWILAYVLEAAFKRFFDLSALRVNSFVHPTLNQLLKTPFSEESQAIKEITKLCCKGYCRDPCAQNLQNPGCLACDFHKNTCAMIFQLPRNKI